MRARRSKQQFLAPQKEVITPYHEQLTTAELKVDERGGPAENDFSTEHRLKKQSMAWRLFRLKTKALTRFLSDH